MAYIQLAYSQVLTNVRFKLHQKPYLSRGLSRGLTDFDEIWHGDAVRPS